MKRVWDQRIADQASAIRDCMDMGAVVLERRTDVGFSASSFPDPEVHASYDWNPMETARRVARGETPPWP